MPVAAGPAVRHDSGMDSTHLKPEQIKAMVRSRHLLFALAGGLHDHHLPRNFRGLRALLPMTRL
jgi:hypothetical protein